jgi:hypothetical protein
MSKPLFLLVVVAGLLISSNDCNGQSWVGLSINYGDRLTFEPYYSNKLPKRSSFSPTIVFGHQLKISSHFSTILGGQLGIAGYQLKVNTNDPVSGGDSYRFGDYGIVLARVEATPGIEIPFEHRYFFIGIGGGVSYYYTVYQQATYQVAEIKQGIEYQTFYAEMNAPRSGVVRPFAKVYVKAPVSNRFAVALQYSSHWKSFIDGTFNINDSGSSLYGKMNLVPRGFSLQLLYKINRSG